MRLGPLLVVAGLAGPGTAVGGGIATAPAAQAAACSGTSGVTVVVDTGSSVQTRCAPGDPGDGFAALQGAGFQVTRVQRFPGALCRIDGLPSSDPCDNMPPTSAYWAFFSAPAGGSWAYQQKGIGAYDPAPGTAVGFRFGSGAQPRVAPPAKPAAPSPTPTTSSARPTARPTTQEPAPAPTDSRPTPSAGPRATTGGGSGPAPSSEGAPPSSGTTSSGRTSGPGGTTSTSSGRRSSSTSRPSRSTTSSAATASSTAGSTPQEDWRAQPADEGSGPSLGPALVGGGLVAGLAAAGVLAARRRGD